jgi:hypothetical protein
MGLIEAVLAVVGLGLLILLAFAALSDDEPPRPPEDDLVAPYREGLHAAVRMQGVAQDLKQQLYAEAMRHAADDSDGET